MSKYFEVDFRKGSFQDQTGRRTVTINGNPEIRRGDKGNYLFSSLNNFLTFSSQIVPDNAYTIVLYFKITNPLSTTTYFINGGNYGIAITPTQILYYLGINNYRYFNYVHNQNWCCLVLTIPGSAINDIVSSEAYINGVKLTNGTTANVGNQEPRTNWTIIGKPTIQTIPREYITYFATYDYVFTEVERNKAYQDFLNSYPIVPEKLPQQSIINKPMSLTHLKDTGLVAAYNMIPNGNTLVDISGNKCTGTIKYCDYTKDGLKVSRDRGQVLTSISLGTIHTVCTRFKLNYSDYQYLWADSSGNNYFHIAPASSRMLYSGTFIYGTAISLNVWHNLVIVRNETAVSVYLDNQLYGSATLSANNSLTITRLFGLGLSNDNTFGSFVQDFKTYNRVLSTQEITNYHNSFINLYLTEDFSSEGADGIAKVPTGWVKQSGSFKIGEWQLIKGNLITDPGFNSSSAWSDPTRIVGSKMIGTNTSGLQYNVTFAGGLVAGKRYKCTLFIESISGTGLKLYVGGTQSAYLSQGLNTTYITTTAANQFIGINMDAFTGSIDNICIEEVPPLPTFKLGTKYLECITAGVIALPSKQAYGTWSKTFYKGADANVQDWLFIASKPQGASFISQNGYLIRLGSDEKFYLYKIVNGSLTALITSVATYVNNTFYEIEVTRSVSGLFSLSLRGGSVGNVLVSIGTATDNTFTTSEYISLDEDAGDRSTLLMLKDGVKQ